LNKKCRKLFIDKFKDLHLNSTENYGTKILILHKMFFYTYLDLGQTNEK
jgi:hypothetical protein